VAIETVRIGYTRLFEVRLLHHYWLDDGATVFDAIADQAVKTNRLLTYDVRRLLRVEPARRPWRAITGLPGGVPHDRDRGFWSQCPTTLSYCSTRPSSSS